MTILRKLTAGLFAAALPVSLDMALGLSPAKIAAQASPVSNAGTALNDRSMTPISGASPLYFEFPIQKMKSAVPALKGIEYDENQQQLTAILDHVAKTIADVLPRLPNLISKEEIYHFQGPHDKLGAGGLASEQPWSRDFKYLILSHHNPDGSTSLEELRTDSKGKSADAQGQFTAPRGFGFAYEWLFFSAAGQREFRFRYLGRQDKFGRKTLVLAFAQDPARVTDPAHFQAGDKVAPFYYQGVLWVDQASFDVVALRTDLLSPLPDLRLRQLTTELTFRSVPIHGYDAVFWLPSELTISSDQGSGPMVENHRYSDYHLFHSEARIVATP